MPKYQLLTGYINLGGSRENTVFRGLDNPITYPESLVLAVIHGGGEHVHTLIDVGEKEISAEAEYERLCLKYNGKLVRAVFPNIAGKPNLPANDPDLPTAAEIEAVREAAEEATKRVRSGGEAATPEPAPAKATGKKAEPKTPGSVPPLADLPK